VQEYDGPGIYIGDSVIIKCIHCGFEKEFRNEYGEEMAFYKNKYKIIEDEKYLSEYKENLDSYKNKYKNMKKA
jgi:hypothetical protein